MKIYLAARYSRRLELCGYRNELVADGHAVTSRWLDGQHQIGRDGTPIGDDGEALVEGGSEVGASLREAFAREDFSDVQRCDMLIAFTEEPDAPYSRGGRHVELGIALGIGRRVWIVGPRENIFCWMAGRLRHFHLWENALASLRFEERAAG